MATAIPKIKFKSTTPGIEDVYFTHGNSTAAAEFGIFRRKLARHTVSKDKGVMGSKVMDNMAHPKIVEPIETI